MGCVNLEDFFGKYGNCDGDNIVGLAAEVYFVRMLRGLGYEVELAVSHNEVRWIRKGGFAYECVGDYGEVLKSMLDELKTVVQEFCEKGVDVLVESDGGVPV